MINEEPKTDKQKLYDALSGEYDLGTYEEFERNIGDSVKRRKLYDAASADYDLGDYESYSKRIGPTHKESLDAFNAEFGSLMNDFEERDTAETKMSRAGMSSGIIVPMEGSITGEERQRYQELHKQEEALKKAWYTSDEYLAQKDAEAFQLAQMRKDIDSGRLAYAQAHPMVEGYNPSATRGAEADKELSMYETASRIMDDTIKLHNAPSRYDGANAWQNVRKFGRGAGDTLSDVDFWTMGLTEIADNFGVREVLAAVQDKLGNLNDLSEEAIENILTPAEKAVLQAWAINAQEQLSRQGDLSRGYQAGQGAVESLGFMAEFMLTGGIGKAAAESVEQMTKWLAKKTLTSKVVGMADEAAEAVLKNMAEKTASSAVRRYGKNLGLSLAEAAGRTGVMPSTFRNISEKATEIRTDEEGNNYLVGMNNAFASGLADSFIETLSEGGRVGALGELFGDVAGKIPFYKRMVDRLSNSKAGELWGMLQSSGVMNTLRAGGWHGIGEEYLEEWYGNALRTLTGMDKDALKEFATWDNQLITVTSFLPLTIFGGTVSTAQVLSAQRGLDKKAAALRSALIDRGYDEAQADNYIDIMKGASPAEISSLLSPIATTVAGRSEMDARALIKPFMDFAMAVRKWQSFDTKYKYQEQEQRDALQQQMESTLGKFWQEDETGARKVQRAVNAQGETVYLLGKQSAADAEAGLPASVPAVTTDGRKMFVDPSEYQLEDELDMNTFLGLEVMAEKGNTERARMLADQERSIQQIRQMAAPGTQVNLGTAEAPVIGVVAQRHPDGVIVTTPDGMARQLTYEELGNYLGINATPLTDAQLDEQESDVILAEEAQREAELDGEYIELTGIPLEEEQHAEEAVENAQAALDIEESLPLDSEGNVDETALWNEEPARWAAWNDEQRQDGGANSITAITAAMTNLSGQIAEQEAAYAAMPVGTERNDLEKQIDANKARLSQLVSLQQGYAAQAEAALQAAAQEQAALSASQAQMTEQQMDEMDAQYEGIYSQTRSLNERARLLQEYLDKISMGAIPVKVLTEANYAQVMADAGCSKYLIQQIKVAIDNGSLIEGFMAAGKAFIFANNIPTIDKGREKYVHERQHVLTRNSDYVSRILATGVTKEQLRGYLRILSQGNFYDGYPIDVMADEFLSFAMELVYTFEDFSVSLQKIGVSESLINVIKTIDDEQSRAANGERLSQARRRRGLYPHVSATSAGSGGQNARDTEKVSRGILDEQGSRPSTDSQRGAGDREGGEGAAEPAVDDEINPAFVEAISADAEDAEWSQAMDDKAFATPPAVDGIEADDVRHSIALEGQMRESTQAYYDKHYKGGKLSKTDQKRVPLNLTHFTQELLDTANAMIEEMRQYMLPYLDMESKGKRFLPAEVYGQSTLFDNASYGKTMENTLICTRTLAYIDFVEEVKKRIGRPLTATESFLASQMLYDIAIDPQCLYCYVSLDRKAYDEFLLRYAQQRDEVIAKWNASDKSEEAKEAIYKEFLDGRKPTAQMKARFESWLLVAEGNDAITLEDLATKARRGQLRMADMPEAWAKASQKYKKLKKDKKLEYAASEEYQNALWGFLASPAGQVADAEAYAQSASWAKKEEDYRSYTGELLKCSADALKGLMGHYGLRFYSFSEYSPAFILENMQMVRDAAARGLKGFAYTKEIDFIRIFAPTGMNINCSVYGRVDSEGNVVPDTKQGADWAQVQELREQYPNVGAVFVATNDSMVEWALNQPWIDVIIPFHIVRTGADIAKFYEWTNYSSMQSDTTNEGKSGYVYPHEHLNDKETFLRITAERGWKPRFEDVKLSDGRSIVEHPNYMRLVNETRRRADETPILTPVFNLEAAKDSFDRFVEKGGYYSGYFVEDGAFEEGIETVVEDIKAGKTAKEVNYGRQDVPIDVAKIMAKRAELERKHRKNPDMLAYAQESLALHEAQQAAEGEDLRFSAKEKSLDTDAGKLRGNAKASIVSSEVLANIEQLKEIYKRSDRSNRTKGFVSLLVRALGIDPNGPSFYKTFSTPKGDITLRISNHNASVSWFDEKGEKEGVSIVISRYKNRGIKKNGTAHVVEYFYPKQRLDKAEQNPMASIVESIEALLKTGDFVDMSGLAYKDEANGNTLFNAVITPQKDADYLAAVERGDMETAQRMVLEAAKLAMPNTKVVDENGNPKVMYHGTIQGTWNKVDYSFSDDGISFFTTDNEEVAWSYKGEDFAPITSLMMHKDAGWKLDSGSWSYRIEDFEQDGYVISEQQIKDYYAGKEVRIERPSEKAHKTNRIYNLFVDMINPLVISNENPVNWDSLTLNGETVTTRQIAEYAMEHGYDGVIIENIYDMGPYVTNEDIESMNLLKPSTVAISFKPTQVKSSEPVTYDDAGNVIPLSERFNPENEDIRFSVANESQAIFVSNAAKAVEAIKMEKATPKQWLAMIEKSGGLKAGEDKWMGLSDWLKASDKKTLTKTEVLDFIGEHMIQIEETHYDANAEDKVADAHSEMERILQEKLNAYKQEWYEENEDESLYGDPAAEYAIEKLREELGDEFPYAFELANGGEVYLTFPYEDDAEMRKWSEKLGVEYDPQAQIENIRLGYTTDGLTNKREIALTVPTIEPWGEEDMTHFGDAGEGRAVAWVRFGETEIPTAEYKLLLDEMDRLKEVARELYEEFGGRSNELAEVEARQEELRLEMRSYKNAGYKVLVIDEIQSKRHQEGREKGYKKSDEEILKEHPELRHWIEKRAEASKHLAEIRESLGDRYLFTDRWTDEEREEWAKWKAEADYAEMGREDYLRSFPIPANEGIPAAPFEKNWHELAMKRMLRYAAENGYDYIAWTKGEQQVVRYGLGGKVDSISSRTFTTDTGETLKNIYIPVAGGLEEFTSYTDLDGNIVGGLGEGRHLSELVGKEIAEKLLAEDTELSGGDLVIGGDGMRGFYDKMLPAFMNKYGKKWGVKVEDIELPNLEEAGRIMHSVPVTDAMKESVMEGQVMFSAIAPHQSSLTEVNDMFHQWNKEEDLVPLMAKALKVAEQFGVEVRFAPGEEMKGYIGQAWGPKVRFNADVFNEAPEQAKASCILHELIHAATEYVMVADEVDLLEEHLAARREIEAIYEEVKNKFSEEYGAMNPSEMIAEMSNPVFREKLKEGNAWERFLNAIRRLLGLEQKDYDRATPTLDALERILETPDTWLEGVTLPEGEDYLRFSAVTITPEVREEMDTIKAKAMWNDTFMKAPNGQPTNLTEDQWLLVRTNNFKNWFGDWENDPENASKVVDENGEPMVVYHGSPNAFTAFDKDMIGETTDPGFYGQGFYFATTKAEAKGYGKHIIDAFVSLENPLDLNTVYEQSKKWDGETADGAVRWWYGLASMFPEQVGDVTYASIERGDWTILELKNRIDELAESSETPFADAMEEFEIDDSFFDWLEESDINIPEEFTSALVANGYDGVINAGAENNEIVALEPSQIKSATETTGEFSESDDIRYSSRFDVDPNPTEAQKKAGNYKMGHLRLDGYNITIENPKGSVRRGTDSNGNEWKNVLNNDYGYIRGTKGVDGDHIDVYLSDNPEEGNVFVVDQVRPDTGEFDEHKVMYGFNSMDEAREAYLANFSEGWNGLGTITEVTKDEFRKWIDSSHRKTKPFSEYKSVKAEGAQSEGYEEEDITYSVLSTPTDEIVAEGMKFSIQDFARLAGNIFEALPEAARKEAIEETFKREWDMQSAIFQIPARLAEKESWDESDKELAKVIRDKVQEAMDESGVVMSRPLTTKEALWMLYRSTEANGDSMMDAAKRAMVAYNLGFDKETLALEDEAREAVRFSAMRDATVNAKASMYNRGAVNVWTRLKESFVDMNASVEELVSAIEERSGKKAKGFENILMALNQQSSKGLAAMESYEMKFLNPMFDEIRKIMNETDFTYEDIVRYVILKHGLERNEKLAQRDARSYYQEIYDDIIDKIRSMNAAQKRTYLTNAQLRDADAKAELARLQAVDTSAMSADEKRDHKKAVAKAQTAVNEAAEHLERAQKIASMSEKEAEDELQMHFDAIAAQTDNKYNELRKNDYSGITSMFYDQLGVNRSDYATEEEYQAALMDAKRHKYDTLEDVENAADMEVKLFEGAVDTKGLWKRINAATKETLRQQYEANMISKEQYDNLRGMFEYYVPLRGFKDNTAEDMYTYYRRPNSTGYTKPILAAEGRKTEAESPFGWIASMAGSAIASNVKNEAKLALYYFVSNRPENGIATVSKTWYVHTPGDVDDNGKRIFRPAYPTFSEDLSTEEAKDRLEQWQEQMRELQKQGLAYESGQKLNLGNAVVNISEANKPEHIVNVKVAGKDYTIIINGNPRAAQAINGDLNIEATAQDYSAVFGPILRWMSSVNTSYNPEFWITNMMRDMAFTWMAVNTKESPEYRRKFGENYRKAFSVISMVAKNEKGTLGDSYLEKMYKEFVENGGVTGYTQIKDNETWEKEIEKYLSSNDPKSIRSGKVMKGVKNVFHAAHRFGESLEQVSRFAAFLTSREMGKSMAEAVNDAKEITVNFNRKGSGKMISLEEAKHLTGRNGKPLSKFWQWVAVAASSISPLGRRFIMFFNAAIQGLNATYKLYKANPKRMIGWTLAYAAVGAMNAVLHAFMDDDDDYLDMPQYERRNSLMIGGGGVYLKWALPQEARAFYALGDIAVESIMGRNPHQNVAEEVGKVLAELLPINPAEGWKAFLPSIAVPAFELLLNEDYKGDPIYNEMKWLTKEERERTAKWSNAKKGTGKTWVLISQGLNNVTGGDMYDAGLINIQPEKMEHLVQSAFGGTIRTLDKFVTTVIAMIDPEEEWTARQTPFLNRVLTINDERFRNVHVNDVFDFYRAEAEHAISLEKKYTKAKDSKALRELRSRDEYKWAKIYTRHRKALENINDKLREADGTKEKKELMKRQDELKKKMIKEFSSAR